MAPSPTPSAPNSAPNSAPYSGPPVAPSLALAAAGSSPAAPATMPAGSEEPTGTRERILAAAAEMFFEDMDARLSVRAVAARAGVSAGSLRHHFPTQRDLQEQLLTRIYDDLLPDDGIHDTSVPPRERLLRCLGRAIAPAMVDAAALREGWASLVETYVVREPTAQERENYLALLRGSRRRVEYWLTVLADEGATGRADIPGRARFLCTVLNGVALDRAFPTEEAFLAEEATTLDLAVDQALRG